MTVPGPSPIQVGPPPGGASPPEPEAYERLLQDSPSWPVTRLAGASMMVILAACMLGPEALTGTRDARWIALLLPGILATITGRVMFETLDSGSRRRRALGHALPALLAATLAAAIMTCSALIVGSSWTAVTTVVIAALSMTTLTAAGVMRDVEIRLRLALRRVFFAGSAEGRRDLEHELRRRSDATFVGSVSVGGPVDAERLAQVILDSHATVLVIDRDAMRVPAMIETASKLNLGGLHIRELVSYYESEFKKVPLAELSPTWFLFDIAEIHHQQFSHALWRAVEMLVAAILALVTSPLLLLSAVAIKTTSRGPILYRQHRVGMGDVPFTLLKLRTMTAGDGTAAWAPSQSHRVTNIGQVLRRFRLDELPQLWNIIRGDLALIGPRPEQVPIVEQLERAIPYYSARHSVRPGLTGWAQVNLGYGGSYEGTVAKLQRDLYYVKHRSWRLDALILWLTIKAVLAGPD